MREIGRSARWVMVVVLAGAVVVVAALGSWQMAVKSRQLPPVADLDSERAAAIQAASLGSVKLLSYSSETVEKDTGAAEALLTGDFLNYYRNFVDKSVIPTARQNGVKTNANVALAGVEGLTSEKASVLVFVNQVTTTLAKPVPETTNSSVRVGLLKKHRAWLIDSFDPV